MSLINAAQIKQAFQRLGELAQENGETIELIVGTRIKSTIRILRLMGGNIWWGLSKLRKQP